MQARILIVEDERITAEDLRDILTDLGYLVVDVVSSGPEAIRRAEESPLDLALMDIHIKGEMDGTEVAHILRSRFNVPVIYLTAHADSETLNRAKLAQPLGYITKPFQEPELRASIEMALYKHAQDVKSTDREEWLSSTLGSIGEGIITVDERGNVILLNSAAEKLTGWPVEEALGRHMDEVFPLLHPASGQKIAPPLERVLAGGAVEEIAGEVTVLRRDGERKPVSASMAPVRNHQGAVSGAVVVFGDAGSAAEGGAGSVAGASAADDGAQSDPDVVAVSPHMKQVLRFARRVAESEASTILLEGESGTGKDVLARYMHKFGARRNGPFVSLNCAAIPETLLESELFGYDRGAFTDARAPKAGILEIANGGTIFLDEIGEMPLVLQAKMLRVLEDQTFRRLGGVKDIHVDLRVMAATNRRLVDAIEQGRFRLDLYYRLNVIQVLIPPLRDRTEDILPLARHFIRVYNVRFRRSVAGLSKAAEEALLRYDWPGNVRELRNMIERAIILEDSDWIQPASLQLEVKGPAASVEEQPASGTLEEAERTMLLKALETTNGNQTRAAAILGISRDALRYKMKKFNAGRRDDADDRRSA